MLECESRVGFFPLLGLLGDAVIFSCSLRFGNLELEQDWLWDLAWWWRLWNWSVDVESKERFLGDGIALIRRLGSWDFELEHVGLRDLVWCWRW